LAKAKVLDFLPVLDEQAVGNSALAAAAKLRQIEQELKSEFIERDSVIKDLMRALAIGEHMLMIGPPGTGKSLLARSLCLHVAGGVYFEWLLNRTTDPSALLGPYSIKGMEQDRFVRKSNNMLPDAHVAFLDEFGKANEPVLNILLSILNERVFHNDGKAVPVKLRTMIAASNEWPDEDGLQALVDRLLFRVQTGRIKEPGNRVKMLKLNIERRNSNGKPTVRTTITVKELDAVNDQVNKTAVPDVIYRALEKLLRGLENEFGITISDRRAAACLKVMQGEAVLNQRGQVTIADLASINNVLWEKPEDIPVIELETAKAINPFDAEMRKLLARVDEISASLSNIDDRIERTKKAVEAKAHYDELITRLEQLAQKAKESGFDPASICEQRMKVILLKDEMLFSCLGIGERKRTNNKSELDF
jgi:MoxR-like ATPase